MKLSHPSQLQKGDKIGPWTFVRYTGSPGGWLDGYEFKSYDGSNYLNVEIVQWLIDNHDVQREVETNCSVCCNSEGVLQYQGFTSNGTIQNASFSMNRGDSFIVVKKVTK